MAATVLERKGAAGGWSPFAPRWRSGRRLPRLCPGGFDRVRNERRFVLLNPESRPVSHADRMLFRIDAGQSRALYTIGHVVHAHLRHCCDLRDVCTVVMHGVE